MATEAEKRAKSKYDAKNATYISLKLNRNTDEDIVTFLKSVPNKQGYIKDLIRQDMGRH